MTKTPSDASRDRSVTTRALRILAAFDVDHPRLALTSLSRRSGLPLSTTHRLVGELEEWGAVEREPDGAYVIGRRLWELSLLAPVHRELSEVAVPYLEDVYVATRQNVHLAVRDGLHSRYVERIHGRTSVPLSSRIGGLLPLHATAAGKVLLADAEPAVVEAALREPERLTATTITDPHRLRQVLAEVRHRGYAHSWGEATPATWSVAVPVRGPGSTTVASLAVVADGPQGNAEQLSAILKVTASALGRDLQRRGRR
jgi:DNA-binding IclR family transcriptional regulator